MPSWIVAAPSSPEGMTWEWQSTNAGITPTVAGG